MFSIKYSNDVAPITLFTQNDSTEVCTFNLSHVIGVNKRKTEK